MVVCALFKTCTVECLLLGQQVGVPVIRVLLVCIGYRLLSLCMHQHHLLSEKSAYMLAQWFEDLHKVILSRKQRMVGVAAPPPMQPSPVYVRNHPSPSVHQM